MSQTQVAPTIAATESPLQRLRARCAVLALAVLLPGVLLLPAWRLAGLGADEDDILYYYPARVLLAEQFHAGQPPWLDPWTGLGRPLAADPQIAVWYPPTWLFYVLPPTIAYAATLWLHYSLAFLGMVVLLRSQRLDRVAAVFGAVAFAFSGFFLAHRAHLTIQNAAAWTPWLLWALARHVQAGGAWRLARGGILGGLMALAGHVQIAAIVALGSLLFAFAIAASWRRALLSWLGVWLLAGGWFAVQLVPTMRYVAECTRGGNNYWDFTQNSWNPATLIAWLSPFLLGQRTPNLFSQRWWGPSHQVEQFAYPGLLVLLLAIAVIMVRGDRHRRIRRAWLAVLVFGALLALGKYGPICPLLYWLPGANLLRVPARALLLVNLALAALAALAVHDLGARLSPALAHRRAWLRGFADAPLRTVALVLAVPVGLVLLTLPLLSPITRAAAWQAVWPTNPAVWSPLLAVSAGVLALGVALRAWAAPHRRAVLCLALAIDLGLVGWSLDVPRGGDLDTYLSTPERQEWLDVIRASQRAECDAPRLWVVGNDKLLYHQPLAKLSPNTNLLVGVPSLAHYGPLQPLHPTTDLQLAPWGESYIAERLLRDTAWMRPLRVGWVLVCDPALAAADGCALVMQTSEGWRLYRNDNIAPSASFADEATLGAIRFERESSARFTTEVYVNPRRADEVARDPDARAAIVVSAVWLPGWKVRDVGDGAEADIAIPPLRTSSGLLAAEVPIGRSVRLRWEYAPAGVWLGATITAVTAALSVALLATGLRRRTT